MIFPHMGQTALYKFILFLAFLSAMTISRSSLTVWISSFFLSCFVQAMCMTGLSSRITMISLSGLWNTRSINEYIGKLLDDDRFLKSVLELSGSSRSVTEKDRDYYRVWSMDWGFSDDVIKIAAAHSGASKYTLGGINKTLAELKENKIETAAKAEEYLSSPRFNSSAAGTVYKNIENREYTKEELRSVFSDRPTIDDVEF